MHFQLSLSWFLVLVSCIICARQAWRPTPNAVRWFYLAMALFFLSILVTGVFTLSTTGGNVH